MQYKLIESNYNGKSPLYKVLCNRGIKDPIHYLNTTEQDVINPQTIKNVPEGAKKLVEHINAESDIFVNVDSDCDGFTSSAVLINWLFRTFPGFAAQHISWGFHQDKGHGLLMNQIEKLHPQLVLCPDAGSEEYEKHKRLKELGIDLIIIDHHNAEKYSEDAIVINNQLDTNYPTKSLSGAGMVYKFCSFLDNLLHKTTVTEMLDLAMTGVIADVMELKDYETRYLVDLGLSKISNPFLTAMIAKNDFYFKDGITATKIAWYVAPAINAITRMGTLEEREILFSAMLEYKAYETILSTKRGHKVGEMETYVEQAVRTCTNVKRRQDKLRDEEFEQIENIIATNRLLDNKILIVKLENPTETSRTITGLIANKLMSTYGRPTLLLNKTLDSQNNVIWAGSARNNPNNGLESIQKFVNDSKLAEYASGHDNACGIAFTDGNLDKFISYSNKELSNIEFTTSYDVDLEYYAQQINSIDILELADANWIWGQGVDEPLIAIKNINIIEDRLHLFGESTLKIDLDDNISLVKFKSSQAEFDNLDPKSGCTVIDIVGRCGKNTGWDNGPQIYITDYNIVRKQEYYF